MATLTALGATHGWAAGDLNDDGTVQMIPYQQKVYFADGRTQADGGYNKLDFVNTRLVGTASGAFTAGEVMTQATSGAKGVFDQTIGSGATAWHLVFRTTATEFNAVNVVTGGTSSETVTPSAVTAPPHWTPWVETSGKEGLPDGGANIGARAFGRIFLNNVFHPNQWYACRTGDPLDWLVSQSDVGTAVSSQTGDAATIGDEITAFVPIRDDYLVIGTVNGVHVMQGDPVQVGQMTQLKSATGIFNNTAHCFDDKGNLFFLGTDGIYVLTPDAIINATPPENVTKEHLPKLISDIGANRRTDRVSMAYDKDRFGIIVQIVQADGAWQTCFWLDLRSKETWGIFPEDYGTSYVGASAMYFNSRRADQRALLIGGQDGYIRKWDDSQVDDDDTDDTTISSRVVVGPLVPRDDPRKQITLEELSLKLGTNTDGVTVELYKEKTAQKVLDNIAASTGLFVSKTFAYDGLTPSIRQKIQGAAIAINIKNATNGETFNIEQLVGNIADSGRIK
jgi:hypothetical protein